MDRDQSIRNEFAALAQGSDDAIDLARGALLIAAAEYPQLDIDHELGLLDSLAAGVSKRLTGDEDPLFCINTLSEYLFDDLGFRGDADGYYDPRNSFLNEVLLRRLGIPITLSLVFLEVGKRLGIPLAGVGMPGHFLLRHRDEEELFIDPFHRGVLLSQEECAQRLEEVTGANVAWDPRLLIVVSNREYLARILRNLKGIYWHNRDHRRSLSVNDRLVALYPESPQERRDRGLAHYQLNHHEQALEDLEFFLESASATGNSEAIQGMVSHLHELLGT